MRPFAWHRFELHFIHERVNNMDAQAADAFFREIFFHIGPFQLINIEARPSVADDYSEFLFINNDLEIDRLVAEFQQSQVEADEQN